MIACKFGSLSYCRFSYMKSLLCILLIVNEIQKAPPQSDNKSKYSSCFSIHLCLINQQQQQQQAYVCQRFLISTTSELNQIQKQFSLNLNFVFVCFHIEKLTFYFFFVFVYLFSSFKLFHLSQSFSNVVYIHIHHCIVFIITIINSALLTTFQHMTICIQ